MAVSNIQTIDLIEFFNNNPEVSDVKFKFKNHDYNKEEVLVANRVVLSCGSDVFRTQFFGSVQDQDFINITDASFEAFKYFLDILYNKQVIWEDLSFKLLAEMFYLAEKYNLGAFTTRIDKENWHQESDSSR